MNNTRYKVEKVNESAQITSKFQHRDPTHKDKEKNDAISIYINGIEVISLKEINDLDKTKILKLIEEIRPTELFKRFTS